MQDWKVTDLKLT